MEIRKLQIVGGSSYMISLPKGWIRSNNLNQGDELILQVEKTFLRIFPKKNLNRLSSVSVSIPKTDDSFLRRFIYALYIQGLDEIVLKGNISPEVVVRVNEIIRDLIGMEMIDVTDDRIVLRCIMRPDFDITHTLRRMYQIVYEMFDCVTKSPNSRDLLKLKEDAHRFYLLAVRLSYKCMRDLVDWDKMNKAIEIRTIMRILKEIADILHDGVSPKDERTRIMLDLRRLFKVVMDTYFNGNLISCEGIMEMTREFKRELVDKDTALFELCRKIETIGEIAFNKSVYEYISIQI